MFQPLKPLIALYLIQEGYPFPFDYTNKAVYLEYEKHLQELNKLVLDEPIRKGLQFKLSLTSVPSTCPNARPLAWFASQAPNIKCTLELCQCLSNHLSSHTQVWVANVQLLQGVPKLEPVQVVVKFLQPSMMSIPPVKELGHSHWQMQYHNSRTRCKGGGWNIWEVE